MCVYVQLARARTQARMYVEEDGGEDEEEEVEVETKINNGN